MAKAASLGKVLPDFPSAAAVVVPACGDREGNYLFFFGIEYYVWVKDDFATVIMCNPVNEINPGNKSLTSVALCCCRIGEKSAAVAYREKMAIPSQRKDSRIGSFVAAGCHVKSPEKHLSLHTTTSRCC